MLVAVRFIPHSNQGVWNRREIQMTRPAIYDYTCFQTALHLNKKYLSDVQLPRIQ